MELRDFTKKHEHIAAKEARKPIKAKFSLERRIKHLQQLEAANALLLPGHNPLAFHDHSAEITALQAELAGLS